MCKEKLGKKITKSLAEYALYISSSRFFPKKSRKLMPLESPNCDWQSTFDRDVTFTATLMI